MYTHARALVVTSLFSLALVGCGGAESTGHTDDTTPGGAPSPAVETMDDDYAKKAAAGQ
jgi:hypothetical protein